jgi:hypothetical protein
MRRLVRKPKVSDLFGVKGRRWLDRLELPAAERESVDSAMRQIAFCESEIAAIEKLVASEALGSAEIRRLMTVPGVGPLTAAAFMAAVGDIDRFPGPKKLVGYLASIRSSASLVRARPPTGGSPSRARPPAATPWSRPRGASSRPRVHCAPSMSAPADAAGRRSRSWQRHASSPACLGVCPPAARTTPTDSPR